MVERIEKNDRHEYWQVQSSAETHKDRGQQESGQDAYDPLSDQTDWKQLLDKSHLWKRNIQIERADISRILFQKVNLRSDPSMLRVDLELTDGAKISPAFLAISRLAALKIKNLSPGDVILPEQIAAGTTLRITVPSNPEIFKKTEQQNVPATAAPAEAGDFDNDQSATLAGQKPVRKTVITTLLKKKIRSEIFVAVAISMLVLMLILWGYFYLQR